MKRLGARRGGFGLLEVSAALLIITVALLHLQASITGAIDAADTSITERAARELCRAKLEEILAGIETAGNAGASERNPQIRWSSTSEEVPVGMPESTTERAVIVTVTVSYPREGAGDQELVNPAGGDGEGISMSAVLPDFVTEAGGL